MRRSPVITRKASPTRSTELTVHEASRLIRASRINRSNARTISGAARPAAGKTLPSGRPSHCTPCSASILTRSLPVNAYRACRRNRSSLLRRNPLASSSSGVPECVTLQRPPPDILIFAPGAAFRSRMTIEKSLSGICRLRAASRAATAASIPAAPPPTTRISIRSIAASRLIQRHPPPRER